MKYFNFVFALLLVLIYSSGNIPPSERFNLWIVSFIIPIALVSNIILMLAGFVLRKKSSLFLLIAFLIGGDYLFSTIGLKSVFRKTPKDANTFTVMNYNLSAFNTGFSHDMEKDEWIKADSLQKSMINWVLHSGADIQCYQEFPLSLKPGDGDLLSAFKSKYDCYFSADTNKLDGSLFGVLIVSRFPIVARGDVMVSWNGYNRIAFADIAKGSDTVRIINVHLQSMQMKGYHPGYSEDLEGQKHNVRIVFRKLKVGVFERSNQIADLVELIESSPYPVICAGDFNEMPYSYSYRLLKKHLKNAFEESGKGFGFSYNGNTLSMLRIDNQFYSSSLKSVSFKTLDTVRYTDHFPLSATYMLAPE